MSAACPFCAIAAGTASAAIVAQGDLVLAFMDRRQPVPGHVLVIPRRHASDICALTADEAAAVMRMARRITLAMRDALQPAGVSLWQSNGRVAGQEVFHFHLHIQPRVPGDHLLQVYPQGVPPVAADAELDRLAAMLRTQLKA